MAKIPNPFSTTTRFGASSTSGSSNDKNQDRLSISSEKNPSSTLLRIQQIYTTHPPHDDSLYRTLWVSPNATSMEIQKSYRKLSRLYHPDKQRRQENENDNDGESSMVVLQLQKIQKAYQILKDDSTRLLYHKYGLQEEDGISNAVLMLTGYENSPKLPSSKEEIELLQWMGFYYDCHQSSSQQQPPRLVEQQPQQQPPSQDDDDDYEQGRRRRQEERIQFLAATIVERVRPFVEGTMSERDVANFIASDCDRLKKLPFGANILRCIGRAYRHSGQRYLSRAQQQAKSKQHNTLYNNNNNNNKPSSSFPVGLPRLLQQLSHNSNIRDSWHDAKHVATAFVASGRVTLKENWLLNQKRKKKNAAETRRKRMEEEEKKKKTTGSSRPTRIAYHNDWDEQVGGGLLFMDDDDDDDDEMVFGGGDDGDDEDDDVPSYLQRDDEEIQQQQQQQLEIMFQSEKVLVELMQIDALWKVHKVLLHRSVKKACDLILSGQYFFYPSHQSSSPPRYDSGESPPYHHYCEDGWVPSSSSGVGVGRQSSSVKVIHANEGRIRAASALVLIGNIMVQSSKEGTAWME